MLQVSPIHKWLMQSGRAQPYSISGEDVNMILSPILGMLDLLGDYIAQRASSEAISADIFL